MLYLHELLASLRWQPYGTVAHIGLPVHRDNLCLLSARFDLNKWARFVAERVEAGRRLFGEL